MKNFSKTDYLLFGFSGKFASSLPKVLVCHCKHISFVCLNNVTVLPKLL